MSVRGEEVSREREEGEEEEDGDGERERTQSALSPVRTTMTGMSECLSVILRAGMGRVSSSLPPLRPGEQRERRGDGPLLDGEELEATELCLSMPGPVLNEPGRGVVVSREGGEEEDRRRVVVWRQVDGPHGGRRAGRGARCTRLLGRV